MEGRYGYRELLERVGGTGGTSPKMVSIIFIMWEVRLAPAGRKGVGVDENVVVNCGGEFYKVLVYLHHLWLHSGVCAKSYIEYSYIGRL